MSSECCSNDSIEDETSSEDNRSDIEDFEGFSKLDTDGISEERHQSPVDLTVGGYQGTASQSDAEDLSINAVSNIDGCESTHIGEKLTSNTAGPLDIAMELVPERADHQANTNDGLLGSTVEDVPDSIKTTASSDKRGRTSMVKGKQRGIPGPKAVKDKAWVLLAAAILKANGKGKEWEEILDTWVKLQRRWDDIEVRQT